MKKANPSVLRQLRNDIPFMALSAGLIVLLGFVVIPSTTMQIGGKIIRRVPTDQKVIALTLDDGPKEPYMSRTLEILAKYDIPATFFLIGLEMNRNPESTKAAIDSGHQVGNHGYTHRSLVFMSESRLAQEISRTDRLIRENGFTGPIAVRPPYGHKFMMLPELLARQNRTTLMWSIAPDDVANRSAREIADAVKREVSPGSIVVMHTMEAHRQTSRDALNYIIPELQADGYRFVTVNELLSYRSRLGD